MGSSRRMSCSSGPEVFDNYYGTPTKPVMDALAGGRDVLFDIDWQGTQQLREKARTDLVSVFVLPPSIPELERRLHERAQDDYETIHRRMAKAADEMRSLGRVRLRRHQSGLNAGLCRCVGDPGGRTAQARASTGVIGFCPKPAGKDLGCQDDASDDFTGAEVIKGGRGLRERPLPQLAAV